MRKIEFWYEIASTYSYLTAMRIEAVAAQAGAGVDWCPFLLGPIFKSQGWDTSPFNVYPAKGRYMVRDIERIAAARGLRFALPDPFPSNGLHAARLALLGKREGWIAPFTRAVYAAQFADRADISDERVLSRILTQVGIDAEHALSASRTPEIKTALRDNTERAQQLGIFGAPTFVTSDGELFWGDDRLEQALSWSVRLAR
jgi:2-hydroxychromene-2-carboxylate isomerase